MLSHQKPGQIIVVQSDSQIRCQEIGSAETRDIGDASIHEVPKATGPKSGGKDLYLGDDLKKYQE